MKAAYLVSIALALASVAVPGMTQPGAQTNRTVYRAGNWFVVRSTHDTTGAVACTGFYMGLGAVQLSKENLILRVPGEIKSIGLRFGEQPPRAPRPPEASEKQIGAVMLAGPDFEALRRSKTLGIEVATAQGGGRHTLQLEGLDAALKNINDGCPLTPAAKQAERAAKQARERAIAARCAPAGVERMRARGVPEWRIKADCPKADLTPR